MIRESRSNERLEMKRGLPDRLEREIAAIARNNGIHKIVLFGSRARGSNTERSDVDIAVYGGNFDAFYFDIRENIHSLLSFDIADARDELKKLVVSEKNSGIVEL